MDKHKGRYIQLHARPARIQFPFSKSACDVPHTMIYSFKHRSMLFCGDEMSFFAVVFHTFRRTIH